MLIFPTPLATTQPLSTLMTNSLPRGVLFTLLFCFLFPSTFHTAPTLSPVGSHLICHATITSLSVFPLFFFSRQFLARRFCAYNYELLVFCAFVPLLMLATILGSNLSRNGLLLRRVFEKKKKIGHVLHRLGEREEEIGKTD
jgi:hypothetical protein